MENKINIVELLKDCPKGMTLNCSMFKNLELDHINKDDKVYPIICRVKTEHGSYNFYTFTKYGCYSLEKYSKCVIFPKDKTTWEGFQKPFKYGDIINIITENNNGYITIFKDNTDKGIETYADFTIVTSRCSLDTSFYNDNIKYQRLATEEEKAKLFDAIEAKGYKWNFKTKTLEKLIEPKFKIGDKIKKKGNNDYRLRTIKSINNNYYVIKTPDWFDNCYTTDKLPFNCQDEYELVHSNKFDITTLKPFDKVLVRFNSLDCWHIQYFEKYDKGEQKYHFICLCECKYEQCIPYEENKHLLDTTNNCDEYYKTW